MATDTAHKWKYISTCPWMDGTWELCSSRPITRVYPFLQVRIWLGTRVWDCWARFTVFTRMFYGSCSQPRQLCREHLLMFGDIFGCLQGRKVLLASSGWRSGMLLNILQRIGQSPQHNFSDQNVNSAAPWKTLLYRAGFQVREHAFRLWIRHFHV